MSLRHSTLALALACGFTIATPVGAEPPETPVYGTDFQALQAFVADPERGIEPGDPGDLFGFLPDLSTGMASVTKSFTLLLAVEAIMDGTVDLNDTIVVSAHAATINNNHTGGHSTAGLATNQFLRFEDLLYGMMLPSGGDASIAIAEHVAEATYPFVANWSDPAKHAAFVWMMNTRAAEIGLDNTLFFNAYGGDHFHGDDNTPGGIVPHRSTARDIARWFEVGLQLPLFREVAGFRGTYPIFGWNSGFSYPGLLAQKPGGNGSCTTCRGAAARRVGRELIGAFQQGVGGDMPPLLDYGFASLFHPTLEAESSPYTGGWIDNDIACVTADRAASVVVRPNGQLTMLLWDVDVDGESVDHLNPITTPFQEFDDLVVGGGGDPEPFQLAAQGRTVPPLPEPMGLAGRRTTPPPPRTPTVFGIEETPEPPPWTRPTVFESGAEIPLATAARVVSAGFGNLVVVAETDQGVYLHSYGIMQGDIIQLRDTEFVGEGTLARVEAPHSSLIVTAHRNEDGRLELTSYTLDAASGKLSNPRDRYIATVIGDELEIAVRRGLRPSYDVMGVYKTASGQRILRSLRVTRSTGAISPSDSSSWSGAASQLALAQVPGFGGRNIFANAFRDAGGRLVVQSFEIEGTGDITQRGSRQDAAGAPLASDATVRLAGFDEGGVLIAVQPDGGVAGQRMEVWSLDPPTWSPSATIDTTVLTPNRIAAEEISQRGVHGLCRVPDDAAEGDFLLATGAPAQEGVSVQAWRSAPRD